MNPSWLPSRCRWCSDVAISESKSMSPSKTHHAICILMFLQKHTGFTIDNQLFLLRSLLAPSWPPWRWLASRSTLVRPGRPRMVFGLNLQHMAPFRVPTTGFCMVFRHATLVFSTPETFLRFWTLKHFRDLGSSHGVHLSIFEVLGSGMLSHFSPNSVYTEGF